MTVHELRELLAGIPDDWLAEVKVTKAAIPIRSWHDSFADLAFPIGGIETMSAEPDAEPDAGPDDEPGWVTILLEDAR